MKKELKKLKEKDRDLWYKNISERTSRKPEDEPFISWMEYFDVKDEFGSTKS